MATIIEQNRERATAIVQVNLTKEVMQVDFDDICEYSGDPDMEDS